MAKVITKKIKEGLDNYVHQQITVEPSTKNGQSQKTKLKKNDGLIEKIDNKVYITEDNRQLLND